AVEELDADRDAVLFTERFHAIQALDAIGNGLAVTHAATIAEEGDDVRHLHRRGLRDLLLEALYDRVVIGLDVHAVRDRSAAGVSHRANEAVVADHGPVRFFEQVDGGESHVSHGLAEVGHRDALVAPAGDRLLEPAFRDRAP